MSEIVNLDEVRQRIRNLDSVPIVPAILRPLLNQLNRPPEDVKIGSLVELVACENSLAAKCLQMANSPLFGRAKPVNTIRGAVIALGIQRLHAILLSACMIDVFRTANGDIDVTVFWEHSFACALVAQQFARKINHPEPEKAHLAGLLHDLGLILSLVIFPEQLRNAITASKNKNIPLEVAERETYGYSHCETGAVAAQEWRLPKEAAEVIRYHHTDDFSDHDDLVSIVHLSDRLCQLGGLGYGYPLMIEVDMLKDPAWEALLTHHPDLRKLDLARFTFELETYFVEVKKMVAVLFRV
jgi:putative nucleotidyltransferase with HDIG domain